MAIILGIDPGSRVTGYGIINTIGNKHQYVASGYIATKTKELPERLRKIHLGITELIQQYQPEQAAIEQVFVCHNPNSALKLGQARGAAIVAMAQYDLQVAEYSPRSIKEAVVGYGGAEKQQVQQMVKRILSLTEAPQADAADALAVAICHAHSNNGLSGLIKKRKTTTRGLR